MSMADKMRLEAEVYRPVRIKKKTAEMAKLHLNEILSGIRFAAHNGKLSYFYNLQHAMMLPLPPERMEMLWKIDAELRKRGFELAYRNAERNEDGTPKDGPDTDGPTDRTLCVTVSWGNGNLMRAQRTNAIKYWLLNAVGIGAALFGIFCIALLIKSAVSGNDKATDEAKKVDKVEMDCVEPDDIEWPICPTDKLNEMPTQQEQRWLDRIQPPRDWETTMIA